MTFRLLFICISLLTLSACNSQTSTDAGDMPINSGPVGDAVKRSEAMAEQTSYQDISADAFAAKMKDANVVILDVRTPAEIEKGKIDGAVELDYRSPTFAAKLAELDPSKTYLVYCASGGRSGNACSMLDGLGAKEVYNLKGGYRAWPK